MSINPEFAERLRRFAARGTPAKPAQKEVIGLVMPDSLKMFSETWGKARLWGVDSSNPDSKDKDSFALTGDLTELKEGHEYIVTGVVKNHPRYGDSIEVTSFQPYLRLNEKAITKYLVDNFKGIGEKSAAKYVEKILADEGASGLEAFRQKLLREPWSISFESINRTGEFSPEERLKTSLAFVQRDLATRLVGIPGIRGQVLNALAKRLVSLLPEVKPGQPQGDPVALSWARLAQDPYEPIPHVPGYGFMMADAIGRSVDIPRESPQRMAALVAHAVQQGCEMGGHVFLRDQQVHEAISKIDGRVSISAALAAAKQRQTIAIDEAGSTPASDPHFDRIYPFSLLRAERSLGRIVAQMCKPHQALHTGPAAGLAEKIQETARKLKSFSKGGMDETQVQALQNILTKRVRLHTITAEPGAGKTAVMEVLTKLLPNKNFIFCAPTGKGAKVLNNRVKDLGCSASTIHSLLQGSAPGDFRFNEEDQLSGDVLVIDEATMPDLALADALFRSVPEGMHVILMGDPGKPGEAGQLPSIAPGRVLQDLMLLPEIDHNHLGKVHRNSGGILEVMREIRRGKLNPTSRDGVVFSGRLPDAETEFQEVVDKYVQAVGRVGIENTVLLMSRRQGEPLEPGWNTTYANAVLRTVMNAGGQKVPGTSVHVGDRVMIRENAAIETVNGEERVVNGDTGTVKSFRMSETDPKKGGAEVINIILDDGRTIPYPGSSGNTLDHAYAATVHLVQGSEYKEVIAVMTGGSPSFINQNMLLTGLSRARNHLHVYGDSKTLEQIARTPMPARNSALLQRVRGHLAESDDDADSVAAKAADEEPAAPRATTHRAA